MLQPIKSVIVCVISGFCRKVDENFAPLGYYAASSGNFLTDILRQTISPIFNSQEFDRMSKIVSAKVPQLAA
jgi:uncharacterized protein YqkB